MEHSRRRARTGSDSSLHTPIASALLADGQMIEMVLEEASGRTRFVTWREGRSDFADSYEIEGGKRLLPYSAENNLLVHRVVRFPSEPKEYGSEADLVEAVTAYIHRYVAVSPLFERLSAYYVLLTWVYDAFNELPYLRVRGEPGSGKTRYLLTVGSICNKPIFASGASTVSPLFRILDAMRGTLVIDESDFRVSDERAEVVKILNNGNVRGFPVLRTEQVAGSQELNPRAYHVFGPKVIATRGLFDDPALESRFLTEHMDADRLRVDVPINLPEEHEREALELRNKLFTFRFRNRNKPRQLAGQLDRSLEPRLAQIFSPLMSVVGDEETREDLRQLAAAYQREIVLDRGAGLEADLLQALADAWHEQGKTPSVFEIVRRAAESGASVDLTAKRAGWILRKKLGIATVRRHGSYVVDPAARERVEHLCARYGVQVSGTPHEVPQVPEVPPAGR